MDEPKELFPKPLMEISLDLGQEEEVLECMKVGSEFERAPYISECHIKEEGVIFSSSTLEPCLLATKPNMEEEICQDDTTSFGLVTLEEDCSKLILGIALEDLCSRDPYLSTQDNERSLQVSFVK